MSRTRRFIALGFRALGRVLWHNWDGALVLFLGLGLPVFLAWAVYAAGLAGIVGTFIVVIVFLVTTVTVCILLHIRGLRMRALAVARAHNARLAAGAAG